MSRVSLPGIGETGDDLITGLQRTGTGTGSTLNNGVLGSPTGSLKRASTFSRSSLLVSPNLSAAPSPVVETTPGAATSTGSNAFPSGLAVGSTIANSHIHHYHYHLYQTTVNEQSSDDKDVDADLEDEKDEAEAEDLQELMELFPDGIPDELLMDDGSGVPQEIVDENGNVITVIKPRQKAMKNIFGVHDLSLKEIESLSFFAKVYRFLHDPSSGFLARLWSVLMVIAIVTSSIMILLQSMPSLKLLDSITFITSFVEFYSVVLFSVDYVLKLFSVHSYADAILPKPLPYNVLLRFFIQPLNLLDFISVVPFWVQYVLGDGATSGNSVSLIFRIVRMMRIIRLLKVAQYSRSIDIFFRVIIQAWDALLLLLFFVGFSCIVFGTLVFLCEQGTLQDETNNPNNATYGRYYRYNLLGTELEESPFTSIPMAFWYVVTTLTTVGYGDMYPTSTFGRLVGGATMLSGVIFISVPLVIFGTYFSIEFSKELERVAFVHRRAEKIKRKQEEKAKKQKAKEKVERERLMAEGGGAFGLDETDPMAAAMGLTGPPPPPPLPGQTQPTEGGVEGEDALGGLGSGRAYRKQSVMVRGSTFLGRQSTFGGIGGIGGVGGQPGAPGDVTIRVNEPGTARGSIMVGSGGMLTPAPVPVGGLIPNMSGLGANGCVCPCVCGARTLAAATIPGENIVGGVRRATISKNGSKLSGGGAIINNPTAADQLAMKKGMELASTVLPDRATAERGAQMMASSAPATLASNMSSAQILEMQNNLESLKVAVSQLGGLLIAGGAPAPSIAKAMMDSVMPPEETKKSRKRSVSSASKAAALAALQGVPSTLPEETSSAAAAPAPSTSGSESPAPASPSQSPSPAPRSSISQPSSGKLKRNSISSTGDGKKEKRSSISKGSTKPADFALPPAAGSDIAPPSPSPKGSPSITEMVPLASPSMISVGASPVSPPAPSPMSPVTPLPAAATSSAPVVVETAPPHTATSISGITPFRAPHTFPPAPSDESTTDCTIRMLESLIDAPKLTEKLLLKPPFRFLHDIVSSMIRKTGFPDNYFDENEMDPTKLTEITPKLEFLEKLLDLISIINESDLSFINPKKIVAGMEHENTNKMLQEFAKAVASGITVSQITNLMENQEAAAAAGGAGAEGVVPGAAPAVSSSAEGAPPAAPGGDDAAAAPPAASPEGTPAASPAPSA